MANKRSAAHLHAGTSNRLAASHSLQSSAVSHPSPLKRGAASVVGGAAKRAKPPVVEAGMDDTGANMDMMPVPQRRQLLNELQMLHRNQSSAIATLGSEGGTASGIAMLEGSDDTLPDSVTATSTPTDRAAASTSTALPVASTSAARPVASTPTARSVAFDAIGNLCLSATISGGEAALQSTSLVLLVEFCLCVILCELSLIFRCGLVYVRDLVCG